MDIFRTISLLSAVSMSATPVFVNAATPVLTESTPKQSSESTTKATSFVDFIEEMVKFAPLDAFNPGFVSLHPGVEAKQPIRLYSIKSTVDDWNAKYADLVLDKSDGKTPKCLILVSRSFKGADIRFSFYRFRLDGSLESAAYMDGKRDAAGNPVQASGVDIPRDITAANVQKESEAELKFWTSGRFRKHLVKRSPAKKPAAK